MHVFVGYARKLPTRNIQTKHDIADFALYIHAKLILMSFFLTFHSRCVCSIYLYTRSLAHLFCIIYLGND